MSGKHRSQQVLVATKNNHSPAAPPQQPTLTTMVALDWKPDATSRWQAFSLPNLGEMLQRWR